MFKECQLSADQCVKEGLDLTTYFVKMQQTSWAKLFNEMRDEEWNMHFIRQMLEENRNADKKIVFTENHEQNEVGRMTLSRKLIGDSPMSESQQMTPQLDRGLSLYKMSRLFTHAFAGQGFLNFIGE
uniref:Uncharacterized protein n=1 Tax=Ciona savignyi TaxID=51511 RepID=H2YVI6_CIOSA